MVEKCVMTSIHSEQPSKQTKRDEVPKKTHTRKQTKKNIRTTQTIRTKKNTRSTRPRRKRRLKRSEKSRLYIVRQTVQKSMSWNKSYPTERMAFWRDKTGNLYRKPRRNWNKSKDFVCLFGLFITEICTVNWLHLTFDFWRAFDIQFIHCSWNVKSAYSSKLKFIWLTLPNDSLASSKLRKIKTHLTCIFIYQISFSSSKEFPFFASRPNLFSFGSKRVFPFSSF
jgi:hypothetical protein